MAQARDNARAVAPAVAGPAPGQVAQAWSGGKIPRAVMIAGAESALREEALSGIRKAAFGASDGGMNWVVLYGPASPDEPAPITPAAILDEAFTPPMFGEPGQPKITVVRRADLLFAPRSKKEDQQAPAARDIFERNLDKIPQWAVLVFEVAQPGALANTRFFKLIAARGGVVKCDLTRGRFGPYGAEALAFELERRGRVLGLELDPGAQAALIARCGQTLGVLEEELAKLSLALGAGDQRRVRVSAEQIAEVCARTRLVGPFEYTDAVAERDLKTALESLGAIFSRGLADRDRAGRAITNDAQIAFRLLGPLTWKLNQLQDLRAALDQGVRELAAFQAAKVPDFRYNAMRRTLRGHTGASLRRAMEALLRLNIELRTGGVNHYEVLERFTWELCRG